MAWSEMAAGTGTLAAAALGGVCWPKSYWEVSSSPNIEPVDSKTGLPQLLVLVTESYPAVCDSMNCSPPGSSVHGILQARILEWVAIPFSRGSFWPRDWTHIACSATFLTIWEMLGQTTNREGAQPNPSADNWIKDLLSKALHQRARPYFPHSQSLRSGNLHSPLILIHQRADRSKNLIIPQLSERKPGSQKSNQNDHIWSSEPCCAWPLRRVRSWWRDLTKRVWPVAS